MRTTFPIDASPDVWARLAVPAGLAAALPGCRSVTAVAGRAGSAGVVETDGIGAGVLEVVVDLSVASVRGLWAGTVERVDDGAVRITGSGAPGTVDLVVRADASRRTLTVEGTVAGPLATVGSAVLAAAVRRMAADVLSAAGAPGPSGQPRGDGLRPQESGAMAPASGTPDLGPSATEPLAAHGSAPPGERAAAARRRRTAVARVAAAAGVVVIVVGRRRRSRRRSG
jgi:carbon monoxide dehydrogenase subunit G